MMTRTTTVNFAAVLAAALACVPLAAAAQEDSWTSVAPMLTARESVAACTVGDQIYAVGGFLGTDGQGIDNNERYNPATDNWTARTPMPTGRRMPVTGVVDGKCYVIGGRLTDGFTPFDVVEEYDPGTNSWRQRAPMPTPRYAHAAAVVDGVIYVFGGVRSLAGGVLGVVEAYDPAANSWTTRSAMPQVRALHTAVAFEDKIYILGGSLDGEAQRFSQVDVYDPATDSWSDAPDMLLPKFSLNAVVAEDRIYTIGGATGFNSISNVEYFDPAAETWTAVNPMQTPRSRFAAAAVDGLIYAIGGTTQFGGQNHVGMNLVEQYTPATGNGGGGNNGCDDPQFTVSSGVVTVSASGGDDTCNIQGALDEAKAMGYPTVRLANGEYSVSYIEIRNYRGSLEGTRRSDTIVHVADSSIDCDAMLAEGSVPAAFKFRGGEPRVRNLTVTVGEPCLAPRLVEPFYTFHFTGGLPADDCDNDVIFATVDRLDLLGLAEEGNGLHGAVAMAGEGALLRNCKKTLLGTGKVNRSTIEGFDFGLYLSMRASGQVDVNFNTFMDNDFGVWVDNASQLLTIQENDFVRTPALGDQFTAILIRTIEPDGPGKNRVVVHRNQFDMPGSQGIGPNGIIISHNLTFPDLSFVATSNSFNMAQSGLGLQVIDADNGIFANNAFSGAGIYGVELFGSQTTVSGWSIVGNDMNGSFTSVADIRLNNQTSDNLIGPGQDAVVFDSGTGNTVLEQ